MSTRCVFVRDTRAKDGIGKLVDLDGNQGEIEYFESPAGPQVRRVRAPLSALTEVELSSQTRVFLFDAVSQAWRAGRADGVIDARALNATEDHYHVRLPNGQKERIPISQLYVRCSRPIEDPTHYLAARVTDTPFFFDGRSQVVSYLTKQRADFGGLTGLASSAVELLEHQVSTVRRILADPVQRYLLADEVGLGKTIEAGVLIRQHVLDRPQDAQVLVVVPAHLVRQWQTELADKFFLPIGSSVRVLSDEQIPDCLEDLGTTSMLVIDEAHRPALHAFDSDPAQRRIYDALRVLAAKIPRLLLLSGTPVLHQEEAFLAMLHLLDRDGYPLIDREGFRQRIHSRQAIADAILDLADDASAYFAGEALQTLEGLFTDDSRLGELCGVVREHIGNDASDVRRSGALRALRTHITETYRLHRRLLRTRRDDARVQLYLPSRTGAICIQHEDQARSEAFDFLDAWRLSLPTCTNGDVAIAHARLFALWVKAALSHPRVLVRHIDFRLALRGHSSEIGLSDDLRETLAPSWAFEGEEILLRERRQLIIDAADVDSRVGHFVNWLRSHTEIKKVIAFVDDPSTADLIARTLQVLLGSNLVFRYSDDAHTVSAFENTRSLAVLVCDVNAEEGLNLQRYGAAVVHFDLPLEPARIEQRIGRVDRLEARGKLRNIVFTAQCPYESEWLTCLSDTIRVFDRSVAPLQYALSEATTRMRLQLASHGRAAIEKETIRLRDPSTGLDAELRRIRAQESLDSVEGDFEADAEFFRSLTKADARAERTGEQALNSWVVERLHFDFCRLDSAIVRYVHDVRKPTLIPLAETVHSFAASIDRSTNARDFRLRLPLRPATFARSVAETKRVELLRVGHPFVDALEVLVRSDDRGTAFAMWRCVPGINSSPRVYFRFDFVVEVHLADLRSDFGGGISLESLRRRADAAFPVQYRTVWLDGDLETVEDRTVLSVLELPYSSKPRPDGGVDTNLRSERWDRVDALVPITDWTDICRRARDFGERRIRDDPKFVELCGRYAALTLSQAADAEEALKSRLAHVSGAAGSSERQMASLEARVSEVLIAGILAPSLRVDAAGAVFLGATRMERA
jgi:ATP-dependent helicase HepA